MDSALINAINTITNNIHIHINTFKLSIIYIFIFIFIFILSGKYYNITILQLTIKNNYY